MIQDTCQRGRESREPKENKGAGHANTTLSTFGRNGTSVKGLAPRHAPHVAM